MRSASILSFAPFIVILDATVEVPLLTISTTLCFGPFNSREDAEEWACEVERLHKRLQKSEETLSCAVLKETGFPTGAFMRAHMGTTDVILAGKEAREPGALIPQSTPEVAARDLGVYVLRAASQAASDTLAQLATKPHP